MWVRYGKYGKNNATFQNKKIQMKYLTSFALAIVIVAIAPIGRTKKTFLELLAIALVFLYLIKHL